MPDKKLNYTILATAIDNKLLNELKDYDIINDNLSHEEIITKISNFSSKIIVFNESLRNFSWHQKIRILELLKIRNINFINITSNIEETLLSDYIFVLDNENVIMEGYLKKVLEEEKILKRLGFGLPFVVDLAIQLRCYKIISKIYFDSESLVNDLWN